jgi:hypothetical protein
MNRSRGPHRDADTNEVEPFDPAATSDSDDSGQRQSCVPEVSLTPHLPIGGNEDRVAVRRRLFIRHVTSRHATNRYSWRYEPEP